MKHKQHFTKHYIHTVHITLSNCATHSTSSCTDRHTHTIHVLGMKQALKLDKEHIPDTVLMLPPYFPICLNNRLGCRTYSIGHTADIVHLVLLQHIRNTLTVQKMMNRKRVRKMSQRKVKNWSYRLKLIQTCLMTRPLLLICFVLFFIRPIL